MSFAISAVSHALFVALLPLHTLRLLYHCIRFIAHAFSSTAQFAISMLDYYVKEQKRIRLVQHRMNHATTYEEFVQHATEMDSLTSQDIWKRDNDGQGLYNAEQIEGYIYHLRELVSLDAVDGMAFALHSMANRNIAGTGSEKLYSKTAIGTKNLIEEYIQTVHDTLLFIRDYRETGPGNGFSPLSTNIGKYKFFMTLLNCYGRTALMLSGGASMAMCSLGVAKALFERNLLPKVITGSSGGAIIAALIATIRDSEIPGCFLRGAFHMDALGRLDQKSSPLRKVLRLLKAGVIMDIEKLQSCMRENIGDMTFEEAYRRSGKILNITVQSSYSMPFVLNYVTAPTVLVWSAACASCAVPLVFKPVTLLARDPVGGNVRPFHPSNVKFSDGSFLADLPSTRVAELFNVNFTIVSQTNPHVVPFLDTETQRCDSDYSVSESWESADDCEVKTQSGLTRNLRRIFNAFSFLLSLSSTSVLHKCYRVCKNFVLAEARFRVMQLYEYGMVPKKLAFFEGVVSQTFTGDVTIAPMQLSMSTLRVILSNPDDDYIQKCMREGARKTWKSISVIRNKCRIERTLEECVETMKIRVLEDLRSGDILLTDRQGESGDEMLNDLLLSVLTEPTRQGEAMPAVQDDGSSILATQTLPAPSLLSPMMPKSLPSDARAPTISIVDNMSSSEEREDVMRT